MTTQTPKPPPYRGGTLHVDRLGEEFLAELRDFAKRSGRSVKGTVVRAVRELIAREDKSK